MTHWKILKKNCPDWTLKSRRIIWAFFPDCIIQCVYFFFLSFLLTSFHSEHLGNTPRNQVLYQNSLFLFFVFFFKQKFPFADRYTFGLKLSAKSHIFRSGTNHPCHLNCHLQVDERFTSLIKHLRLRHLLSSPSPSSLRSTSCVDSQRCQSSLQLLTSG